MARIKCKACARVYPYQGDCCPYCGAFNRSPRRGYIGADGTVHSVDEKVCYEKKVCFEEQAEKVWKESPDRKPERKSKAAARKRNDEAKAADARFQERFNEYAGRATKAFQSRRPAKKDPKAVVILTVVIAVFSLFTELADNIGVFDRHQAVPEPDYPSVSVGGEYYDYGGDFVIGDGQTLVAFVNDAVLSDEGVIKLDVYCNTDQESRFTPIVIDGISGEGYSPIGVDEWQDHNYDIVFQLHEHDPKEYIYYFVYQDQLTGEMLTLAEFRNGSPVEGSPRGHYAEFMMPDGMYVKVEMTMTCHDDELSVTANHNCDSNLLRPLVWDMSTDLYYEPVYQLDYGTGEYLYRFDVSECDEAYRGHLAFGYEIISNGEIAFLMEY